VAAPLAGLAVLVTRPAGQAEPLCSRLRELGSAVFPLPTLAIEPLPLDATLREALRAAATADWLVFVSRNAADIGLNALAELGLPVGGKIAAIGPATARALESRGLRVHLYPEDRSDSEALLAADWDVRRQRVAIVRGVGGRALLGDALAQRGAEVRYVEVYRRALPAGDAGPVLAHWLGAGAAAAVVTSQDGLANLVRLTPIGQRDALRQATLICVSERVAGAAREQGFRGQQVVAPAPGDEGIVQALLTIADNKQKRNDND
jgi:uroporphyrinogen-III synthase